MTRWVPLMTRIMKRETDIDKAYAEITDHDADRSPFRDLGNGGEEVLDVTTETKMDLQRVAYRVQCNAEL